MSMPLIFLTADAGLAAHWQLALPAGQAGNPASMTDAPASIVLLDDALLHNDLWSLHWQTLLARHRVVLLSLNPADDAGFAALSAGCAGYCHALASAEQLRQVLAVVESGEIWAGRTLVLRMVAAMRALPGAAAEPDLSVLSEREREVALLVARGLANKEIARMLSISERTVKAHLSACFEKFGVSDRVQLVLQVKGLR